MPALRIPPQYHECLRRILALDPTSSVSLAEALATAPMSLDWRKLSATVSDRVQGLSPGDVSVILETLVALYSVRAVLDGPVEQFITDLLDGLRTSGDFPQVSACTEEHLMRLFSPLLGLDSSVGLLSKARHLLNEYQKVYCSARVVTDLRPVFAGDAGSPPAAMIVVHTFRVHYHQGGEFKEIFLSLDTSDIKALRELLDRAEEKASSLRSLVNSWDIPCLETE